MGKSYAGLKIHLPKSCLTASLSKMRISAKKFWTLVIIDAKYHGYLEKQNRLVEAMHTLEKKKIPANLDYKTISHLTG